MILSYIGWHAFNMLIILTKHKFLILTTQIVVWSRIFLEAKIDHHRFSGECAGNDSMRCHRNWYLIYFLGVCSWAAVLNLQPLPKSSCVVNCCNKWIKEREGLCCEQKHWPSLSLFKWPCMEIKITPTCKHLLILFPETNTAFRVSWGTRRHHSHADEKWAFAGKTIYSALDCSFWFDRRESERPEDHSVDSGLDNLTDKVTEEEGPEACTAPWLESRASSERCNQKLLKW